MTPDEIHALLTDYQKGQLIYIHFEGDFKYSTDRKTRVAPKAWRTMIKTLIDNGLIVVNNGVKLTNVAKAYLDKYHLEIKSLD